MVPVPRDLVDAIGEQKIRALLAKWAEGLRELAADPKHRRGSVAPRSDWDGEKVSHCGIEVKRHEHV